jgi:hypothetical protein
MIGVKNPHEIDKGPVSNGSCGSPAENAARCYVRSATLSPPQTLPAISFLPHFMRPCGFEDELGRGVFEYDKPSSLFGQYGDERVTETARHNDQVLDAVLRNAAQ